MEDFVLMITELEDTIVSPPTAEKLKSFTNINGTDVCIEVNFDVLKK